MKIILAAGGTGGHIYPAIAVAQALQKYPDTEIQFIGVGRELEEKLISQAGFPYQRLAFVPLLGGGLKGVVRLLSALPGGIFKGLRLFSQLKPQVVVGFGGYPSFLPMLVAWLKGVPSILQEQNVQVGVANKILSIFAKKIFAVPGAHGFINKRRVTEILNPVREAIAGITPWTPPREELRVLIIGGSQGAVSLNKAVCELREVFTASGVQLTHQTGEVDFKRVKEHFKQYPQVDVRPYIDDMAEAYQQAHLIISRAGAMSVAEIATAGRPAIFIPLPIAKAHQEKNALPLAAAGGATIIQQDAHLRQKLEQAVRAFLKDPEKLASMAEAARRFASQGGGPAAEVIASEIRKLAQE